MLPGCSHSGCALLKTLLRQSCNKSEANNYQLLVTRHLSLRGGLSYYKDIVANLKRLFVNKQNNVYSYHLLVSCRQKPGESISEFAQALKLLAK